MLDFLELEETVGRTWHRLVGGTASYPVHVDHAVPLAEIRGQIAVMYRALGGEAGVQIASAGARRSGHRLGWRQRIGLGDERLDQPGRDDTTIFLPERIAIFADRELNATLYRWLAAWFATAPVETVGESDPLRRDLLILRRARDITDLLLTRFPGSPPATHGSPRPLQCLGHAGHCLASNMRWSRLFSPCSAPASRLQARCGRP